MTLKVALAQIAPVWLDRKATLEKVIDHVDQAADQAADLVTFGEALVPGYPFWPELTEGARFESPVQKEIFAHYAENAVDIDRGDLRELCTRADKKNIAIYCGTIEKSAARGGFSLFASLVYINKSGELSSVHRKLMPTYEERLVWSPGDGHGLRVHELGEFRVGGLNCWENWMPLPRAALYGMGENLHVAVWPGNKRNTVDITRFIARESRSFVISVSGLMHRDWIPDDFPRRQDIFNASSGWMANGGSCVAAPNGEWLVEPQIEKEGLFFADLSLDWVARERQNFDPAGHYSRPDVTSLKVNRKRQSTVETED